MPVPDDDPFAPRPKPPQPLDAMSVHELEARVEDLKAEIARCEAMIAAKKGHLNAADAIFGRKTS